MVAARREREREGGRVREKKNDWERRGECDNRRVCVATCVGEAELAPVSLRLGAVVGLFLGCSRRRACIIQNELSGAHGHTGT